MGPELCQKAEHLYFSSHVHAFQRGKSDKGYSGSQLYILLSTYLCVISFLYLDLYLIGDDTWMR